jgi:hypothetical protein
MAERKNAVVTLLGRDWEIAPYKLGSMIKAAEFVDSAKARNEKVAERLGIYITPDDTEPEIRSKALQIAAGTTLAEMMATMQDAVAILHIGISKIDPSVTVEAMLDDIDNTPQAFANIMVGMNAVLGQSGMKLGEATAPAPQAEVPGASGESSAE